MDARPHSGPKAADFAPRALALAALFAFAYWLLRRYCLSLPVPDSTISYVWLPDGLALGVLLCSRVRQWPLFLVPVLLIGLVYTRRAFGPALLGIGINILEPALVALVLKRLLGSPPRIDSVKGISTMFLATVPLMAGATLLGAGLDWFAHPGHYWQVWRAWFTADAMGMVLMAPLILAWAGGDPGSMRIPRPARALEIAISFGGLVLATHSAYSIQGGYGVGLAIAAATVPFLLWISLRFGMRGATLGLAIFALQSFWYTANGLGHWAINFPRTGESVVALQLYLLLVALVMLLPAALITERQRALSESLDWRRRYESVLAAGDTLMYEVMPSTRRFIWAGNVNKVLGIAVESIPDAPAWLARVHPEDRHLLEGIRARFATGELNAVSREYRVRRDDGSYAWVGVTAYAVGEHAGETMPFPVPLTDVRIVGFIRDISEKRRAAEERWALEERLKRSQKMEAIGRFADGIAHDFNNILGAVLGYGELAKAKAPAGSDLQRYLDTIMSSGERGRALVAQILTFSRAKPAERRPVRIPELVDEVVAQVRGSLTEGCSITLSNAPRNCLVLGEAVQLHQLLMNLCTNAIQAIPGGGEVKVSVRPTQVEAPRDAHIGALRPGMYVEIEVRDSGQGMDEATIGRIFEPFFTTKPAGRGTGLGLALVQGITMEHNGALDIESAPGRGTRIRVHLPGFAGELSEAAVPSGELPRGRGQTVMVVDDEPAMASLAQELLAGLGYEAVAYLSSVAALGAFEKDPARFDAIVSDEVMPELTGTQLAARVRRMQRAIPILIVSGYGGAGFELRAHDAGVDRILRKPYRAAELAEALAGVFAMRT